MLRNASCRLLGFAACSGLRKMPAQAMAMGTAVAQNVVGSPGFLATGPLHVPPIAEAAPIPATIAEEEIMEAERQLQALGCSSSQVKAYLEWGQKEFRNLPAPMLNTAEHLKQLPLAIQILDGTLLAGVPEEQWAALTAAAQAILRGAARDLNKDGRVEFLEFVVWAAMEGKARRGDPLARLCITFRLMDLDGDGFLEPEELAAWFRIGIRAGTFRLPVGCAGTEELAHDYVGRHASQPTRGLSFAEFLQAALEAGPELPDTAAQLV